MFYSLMNGGKKHIRLSFMIFFAVLLLAGIFFWFQSFRQRPIKNNNRNQPVACTMEAKLCPDGSYVGRTGLNCFFSPCPQVKIKPSDIAENQSDKLIIDFPKPNDKIISPVIISGQARGVWFFEASFPVQLTDDQGKIIAESFAQAKGDWMTTDLVPFQAELIFTTPVGQTSGYLILKKDNPSGLPEHDAEFKIPVYF